MVTLHGYILRELLKTLGLSVTALTVLFTMGGGLYNVIRFEGVSAGDVLQFLPLLIPIVITLTLPLAALFSATMVYGRLAADNELVACRAAGINIHRLFLSAILLSIFVAAFTLLFGNFVIPGFVQRISNSARNNLRDMVAQHLQHEGFIHHREKNGGRRYTLTAERVQGVTDAALREKGFETGPGLQYLLISEPTFLHIGADGDLVQFASAQYGLCLFDTRPTPVKLTVFISEGRDFEVSKRAFYVGEQAIGPLSVPVPSPFSLSTADLRSLLLWRSHPWEAPRLRDQIKDFLVGLAEQRFVDYCTERLSAGEAVSLFDESGREYRITCDSVRPDKRGLTLTHGRVAVFSPARAPTTTYEAARVELRTRPWPSQILVEINLLRTADQDVLERDARAGRNEPPRRKPTTNLDGAIVPAEIMHEVEQYPAAAVLDPNVPLPTGEELGYKRVSLQKAGFELQRKIAAAIHFRLGYTGSILVTILMGAALGVIFRGSRALAAFGLATIPMFSVMILMMLGRKLTEDALTAPIGPLVIWGGLLAVLVADVVIMRVGVRR